MLARRIIPCLDIKDGRVVKGVHFVDIRDAGDPVACAQAYCQAGADELAMLDITATVEGRRTMIEVVRAASPAVVLDIPHGWNAWTRQTLLAADEIILSATPDLASLRNAKNICDLLGGSRPHDAKPRLILNQVGVVKRPEIPVKDFAEAIGIEPLLVLPFDPQLFGTAANNGQMLAQLNAASRAAQGFEHLARMLTGRQPAPEGKAKRDSFLKLLGGLNRKTLKKAG